MKLCFETCGLVQYHYSLVCFSYKLFHKENTAFFAIIWELLSKEVFV